MLTSGSKRILPSHYCWETYKRHDNLDPLDFEERRADVADMKEEMGLDFVTNKYSILNDKS